MVEEELTDEEEVGRGVGEVVDVDEVPGFGDGGAEGAFFGDKGEGWSGVDNVGEFGDEEGESEEEERRLRWRIPWKGKSNVERVSQLNQLQN